MSEQVKKAKVPKGYNWQPDADIKLTLKGSTIQYLVHLAELFKPLEMIKDTTMQQMIMNGDAKPFYGEDTVEDVISDNPPTDSKIVNTHGEALSSETNKTDESTSTEKPKMTVV